MAFTAWKCRAMSESRGVSSLLVVWEGGAQENGTGRLLLSAVGRRGNETCCLFFNFFFSVLDFLLEKNSASSWWTPSLGSQRQSHVSWDSPKISWRICEYGLIQELNPYPLSISCCGGGSQCATVTIFFRVALGTLGQWTFSNYIILN